jgi:hypothetical protein
VGGDLLLAHGDYYLPSLRLEEGEERDNTEWEIPATTYPAQLNEMMDAS